MSPSDDVGQDAAQAMSFSVEFCNEQGFPKNASAGLVQTGNREFYRAGSSAWTVERARQSRTAHFCARCNDEPPADLGYSLRTSSGHVLRGGKYWWARHPVGLFPRIDRMPRVRLGRGW